MTTKVYLLHDSRMALHHPLPSLQKKDRDSDDDYDAAPFENSDRIAAIYNKLLNLEVRLLLTSQWMFSNHESQRRFLELECKPVSRETVELVHSSTHFDEMRETQFMSETELRDMAVPYDLYFNHFTFLAASLACGGVVQCVDAVTNDNAETMRAIAVVRPPGHHAMIPASFIFPFIVDHLTAQLVKRVRIHFSIPEQAVSQKSEVVLELEPTSILFGAKGAWAMWSTQPPLVKSFCRFYAPSSLISS